MKLLQVLHARHARCGRRRGGRWRARPAAHHRRSSSSPSASSPKDSSLVSFLSRFLGAAAAAASASAFLFLRSARVSVDGSLTDLMLCKS